MQRSSSILLLGCALAGAASGQRQARHVFDPTTARFDTAVSYPAQSGAPSSPAGEVIGYTARGAGLPVTNGFSLAELGPAAADLVVDGHTLVPILQLTPEELDGVDRLVVGLTSTEHFFSEPDVDAIEDFVLAGGKLVFLGENNFLFHLGNVAVGGRFGIVYPLVDPIEEVLTDVTEHPLTDGPFGQVRSIDASTNGPAGFGSSLPGPFGTSLVRFSNGSTPVVLIEPNALAPGSGMIVAFTDINLFSQDYLRADNRALWRNTFAYGGTFTVDFETADDFVAPLQNGRALASPQEFDRMLALTSSGANAGAAIFASDPSGPNSSCQDRDLLIGRGNVLILQNSQVPTQTVPGFFDRPNDDQDGGFLTFTFPAPVQPLSLVLVDIDAGSAQGSSVSLTDAAGRSRVFHVPPRWTEDVLADGPPGWRTLDLASSAPQAGFASTVTVTQAPTFDPRNVRRIDVRLGSSGAVDDLSFVRFCGPH